MNSCVESKIIISKFGVEKIEQMVMFHKYLVDVTFFSF